MPGGIDVGRLVAEGAGAGLKRVQNWCLKADCDQRGPHRRSPPILQSIDILPSVKYNVSVLDSFFEEKLPGFSSASSICACVFTIR